jgi:xanthine dehydrogenase accessory factor
MSTSAHDVIAAAQRLQDQGQPYALVSVLRVQPPASARPGDKAVVTADGIVGGWIGGGCAQPAVLKTVRQALVDGRARLIRIAPSEEGEVRELGDVLEFGMACHSGGTLELFVDPVLPRARLIVIGDSPVAVSLAALAPRVGFDTSVIVQGADAARFADAIQVVDTDDAAVVGQRVAPGAFVVVATQGRRDVQGLRAALALQARTVWFVASARKAQVLRASLVEAGADAQAVAAIVAPAGQAIGAQTPEEIALSVLASVVAARRGVVPVASAVVATAGASDATASASAPLEVPKARVSSAAAAARARLQARAAESADAPVAAFAASPAETAVPSCCGGAASDAEGEPARVTAPAAASCCGTEAVPTAPPATVPPPSCCGG